MEFNITVMLKKTGNYKGPEESKIDELLTLNGKSDSDKSTNEGQSDNPRSHGADPGTSGKNANRAGEQELSEEPLQQGTNLTNAAKV
jgi:hypothetical protein